MTITSENRLVLNTTYFSKAERIGGGYNAEVYVVDNVPKIVIKVIGGQKHQTSKVINLTNLRAYELGATIGEYESQLRAQGIILPDYFLWFIDPPDAKGFVSLVLVQEYVGNDDAKSRLQKATTESEIKEVLQGIFTIMRPIFSPAVMGQLGLDPLPENFLFWNKRIIYVDLMPPRLLVNDRAIVEYPEPISKIGFQLGFWKHFTPDGLLVILLTQLARIRPEWFPLFWKEIKGWSEIQGLTTEQQEPVAEKLERYILSDDCDPAGVIESAEDPYLFRLTISQLASKIGLAKDVLDKAFKLTHYEDGSFDDALLKAKKLVIDTINS